MLNNFVGRKRAVALPPHLVQALPSGRLRRLVLPLAQHRALAAGDALWVREGICVSDHQPRAGELAFSYAGESRRTVVGWPRVIGRPGAGHRPPEAMPVQASRFTLLVDKVEHLRLAQVGELDALAAGVTIEGEGFGALGYPFMNPFGSSAEAMVFLFQDLHRPSEENPEVALVEFQAFSRNIAMLIVPGTGGAA
ncbi:MAG: hypothetical protein GYB50_04060 [Rhodobacteraceae bacterium]|nr:hypothetical protein [Paracoccaceae bacterium]